jgi:hypothetical protein
VVRFLNWVRLVIFMFLTSVTVDDRHHGPIFVLGSTAAPAVVRRAPAVSNVESPASNTLAAETRKRQAGTCNQNRNEHKLEFRS